MFEKHAHDPVLFAFDPYQQIENELLQIPTFSKGEFTLKKFPNEENYLYLHTPVKGRTCLVLGSLAPPDSNIFSFLMLCHTLKKEKAATIITLLPYLAYSRHDKKEACKSFGASLIGDLIHCVGVDSVITIDVHSPHVKRVFSSYLISLFPAKIFAQEIIAQNKHNSTIVAPDEGAINRCKAVAKAAGIRRDIVYLEKQRTDEGIIHHKVHGIVGESVIVIDDILDTGGTLVSCCEKLSKAGAKEIIVMVTHGLFTGNKWEKLWQLGVNHIYCTNTVPISQKILSSKITILSIIPLLKEYFTSK